MLILKGLVLIIGIAGLLYGLYCQTKARQNISREKLATLKDTSRVATGPMPPKKILSDEGLKYHRGFNVGVAIFIASILVLFIISKL